MKNLIKATVILLLLTSCYQWGKLDFYVLEIEKRNSAAISKLHNSLYCELTAEEIKEIKEISSKEKFNYYGLEYLEKEEKFIFRRNRAIKNSKYNHGIYSRLIGSQEDILLKSFDKSISKFIFNPDRSKIFIEFYKKGIGVYSFPNFKLLKYMTGKEIRWDKNTNKLYYIRGWKDNSKLYSLDKNHKEKIVYNKPLSTYRILNNSDILIVVKENKYSWYYLLRGWQARYKSFLLSNPNNNLVVAPGSVRAVIKSLVYLRKRNKNFQHSNIKEF